MNEPTHVFETVADLDACSYSLPCDMRDEAAAALSTGEETAIEYRRQWEYNQQATEWIYFPNAGRGGVCEGGNTDWTDCDGLDDLEERWANYEEQWSN